MIQTNILGRIRRDSFKFLEELKADFDNFSTGFGHKSRIIKQSFAYETALDSFLARQLDFWSRCSVRD
jgi:hypothetical protein